MDPVPIEVEGESSGSEEDFDDTDSHYTDEDEDGSDDVDSSGVDIDLDGSDDTEGDDSDEEESEDEGDQILVEMTKPYKPVSEQGHVEETDYDVVSKMEWVNLKSMIMLSDSVLIAEWFSKRNISPEAKKNIAKVFSPLNLAARVSNPQIFHFLLGEGFPVDTIIHPFLDAALNHKFDIMQTLLEIGTDVNVSDASGSTALHLVARQMTCKPKKIRFLLSKGANIEQKDNYGMTPLHYALQMGSKGTVVTLLRAGASVKAQNGRGRSVLHMAVYRGLKMAALVYKAGARAGTSEKYPEMEAAVKYHNLEMVRFLIKRNAPAKVSLKTLLAATMFNEEEEVKNQLIDMLVGAGFNSRTHNLDTRVVIEDKQGNNYVINKLVHPSCNPRSLQQLSCFCIRDVFRESSVCITQSVKQLPVPDVLKDYILLKHVTDKI